MPTAVTFKTHASCSFSCRSLTQLGIVLQSA